MLSLMNNDVYQMRMVYLVVVVIFSVYNGSMTVTCCK